MQVERLAAIRTQGETNQPPAMLGHEIDDFRSDVLGRDGEIAFVLAILVVYNDQHPACAKVLNRLRNGRERHMYTGYLVFWMGQQTSAVPAVIQSLRIIHPSANLALVRIPSAHARRKYDAARQSTAFAVRHADLALWAAARGLLALRR